MTVCTITLELDGAAPKGGRAHCCAAGGEIPAGWIAAEGPLPALKVGDRLAGEGAEFTVLSLGWLPGGGATASRRSCLLEPLADVAPGRYACAAERKGYALAWITLSDKGAAGKRTDESGPLIGEMAAGRLDLRLVQGFIIPDEPSRLKALLVELALGQGFDLVMTTGGTGVGPRDITPEATLAVIEKRLPGYERAMTGASLAKTPHGAISRAVAGTLGEALIVNMPGSPKAVAECLEPLLPTLRHTLEKLQGDPSDCAILRK
ncbi:MogA/MoaB family molybdenum cofactor biosynthesis protein [Pseudodesulfovibrio sp.]|uniref:MogA/MoaB family molybdenum cofactor biosynthesis protein n=1 Tax=Pseudodesulfovibrio sp. TaxID=2035812 RepID=UPI00260EDFC1|nr:MogA/MoaB family molybdenum cofactor biosynthesis protein [Pseudodesulfovibrio sp.]MDD3312190.1 MogA/MoaB family molybdenum cofactor biosynthesis protein [Pseudodesulfovibrio sp.]